MKAYIKAISYCLPSKVITNEDLEKEFPDWSSEKIGKKIGILERHIAAENELSSDLGIAAAEKLFDEYGINPKEIDFLLFCTQSPDYFLPTTSCLMQTKLGLSTSCGALDYNLGCSGFIYGLALAKSLVISGIANNVLLITAETYSKFIHKNDKGNKAIFGDAAAATVISSSGKAEIGNFSLGTDGRGANNLIVRNGGMRFPSRDGIVETSEDGQIRSNDHLFMDGPEIFNFTIEAVPPLVQATLDKNTLQKEDIDFFVFHQANKYILDYLRKKIVIPEDKFVYCLEQFGNTVSSTIPIALYETEKNNPSMGKVLLVGFGVGYSWGGTILTYL